MLKAFYLHSNEMLFWVNILQQCLKPLCSSYDYVFGFFCRQSAAAACKLNQDFPENMTTQLLIYCLKIHTRSFFKCLRGWNVVEEPLIDVFEKTKRFSNCFFFSSTQGMCKSFAKREEAVCAGEIPRTLGNYVNFTRTL